MATGARVQRPFSARAGVILDRVEARARLCSWCPRRGTGPNCVGVDTGLSEYRAIFDADPNVQ